MKRSVLYRQLQIAFTLYTNLRTEESHDICRPYGLRRRDYTVPSLCTLAFHNMPALGSPSEASPDTQTNTERGQQKSFSCVLCSQRKVKCDRRPGGCTGCAKTRLPCLYKAPPPPRRRKKGVRDVDTTTRLRIYEEALRQLGVDPEELVKQESLDKPVDREVSGVNGFLERRVPGMQQKTKFTAEVGVLISDAGKSRYLENGIWTSLRSEFRDTKEILEESSDEDDSSQEYDTSELITIAPDGTGILFEGQSLSIDLATLHPEPVQIFKLWQTYLDNINPLVKVFHAPTVQQLILDASGDIKLTPRNVEALLFAIYCITVESLNDGECWSILGRPKTSALQRFRYGAQRALTNVNLLRTSDMMVLQAFTLFILSLQNFDARVIWIWSGIAQRMGQRIGLHRDGAKLGLPPFEVEMRRRLWWQIMMLEGYSQKLAGTGSAGTILKGDVTMPSNVNDSDLFLGMKEPPKEHEGATEMMFFLIRCYVGEFLKRSADSHTTFDGVWHRLTSSAVHVAIKDKAIGELQTLFQRKFLQYCDPSIPWHFMCSQLGSSIIFMMSFMAHSTEYSSGDLSQAEKDTLFDLALKVIAAQNLAYTMKEMRGFMWHVNLNFQWKAFVYVLSELRYRIRGAQVDQAWEEIETAYKSHPSFDKALARRALPVAVNNLALKAWEAYLTGHDTTPAEEPGFIQMIRYRRNHVKLPTKTSQQPAFEFTRATKEDATRDTNRLVSDDPLAVANILPAFEWNAVEFDANLGMTNDTPDTAPLHNSVNINWEAWDSLVVDYQTSFDADDDMAIDLSAFDFGPHQN